MQYQLLQDYYSLPVRKVFFMIFPLMEGKFSEFRKCVNKVQYSLSLVSSHILTSGIFRGFGIYSNNIHNDLLRRTGSSKICRTTSMYVYMCICMYVCMYVCMCVCMRVCVCVCVLTLTLWSYSSPGIVELYMLFLRQISVSFDPG